MLKWTSELPTQEGWYWVKGGDLFLGIDEHEIVEVYLSVGGLRTRGQCCSCRWKGAPRIEDLARVPHPGLPDHHFQWAGPIPFPED